MESKPNLVINIIAELPEIPEKVQNLDSMSSAPSKCRRYKGNEIADYLWELHNCRMQVELAKQKLDIIQKSKRLARPRKKTRRDRTEGKEEET